MIVFLTACSFGGNDGGGFSAPPAEAQQAEQEAKREPTVMDTFRALAPPEGLKVTPLFSQPLEDPNARIARLEGTVQTLRNDIDTLVPSMIRLVAVEKDMKDLINQLKTLTDGPVPAPAIPVEQEGMAPPAQEIPGEDVAEGTETVPQGTGPTASSSLVTPEAAPKGELPPEGAASPIPDPPAASAPADPAPPRQAAETAPPPQPTQKSGHVREVRAGDHPDKTRIVVDMTAKTDFVARMEDGGKTLVVAMPRMDWSAIKAYVARSGNLVVGWKVENDSLKVELLYPAVIKLQEVLPPNGKPHHRLVIDLVSEDVHG